MKKKVNMIWSMRGVVTEPFFSWSRGVEINSVVPIALIVTKAED